MEIGAKDGWKTELQKGSKKKLGRGLGFPTTDQTVSRHHVSFELHEDSETRVHFEVIGKNPIWVLSSRTGEIRVFSRNQRGEMDSGDSFCVSSKNPIWFSLQKIEFSEISRCGFESFSVSDIDPVKEFGFIVMGHEFDAYPKKMICSIKQWNWFLEEPTKDSEDDEVCEKKSGTRRKRKQVEGNDDDDDWMGESNEDKELVAEVGKNQKPKYSTRSKDHNKTPKETKSGKNENNNKTEDAEDNDEVEDEDEDEDEDTLGGFIVDDSEEEPEEESEEEEEDNFEEEDEEIDE